MISRWGSAEKRLGIRDYLTWRNWFFLFLFLFSLLSWWRGGEVGVIVCLQGVVDERGK